MADPSGRLYLRCSSNRKASKQVTVLSFFRLYRPSHGRLLFPAEIIDLLKGFIIGLSVYVMSYIDTSMMYHLIKSQSVIKLYLFYNMLEASTHYPYTYLLKVFFPSLIRQQGLKKKTKLINAGPTSIPESKERRIN